MVWNPKDTTHQLPTKSMKIPCTALALLAFHSSVFQSNAFSPLHQPVSKTSLTELHSMSPAAVAGGVAARQMPGGGPPGPPRDPRKMWDEASLVTVQGGSLKTWSFSSPLVERVQVVLNTEGRPLDADIELWQGPDNTPHKIRCYIEDGSLRPFSAIIETPRGPNTIAIRNIGNLEFPLAAMVAADSSGSPAPVSGGASSNIIQGGALRTYPFDPSVDSVQVLLKTDGRPLNSRIELLQGPNNNKQIIELYTEDGLDRPFLAILETPGSGNVVRIVNTSTMEFPLTAWVEAYTITDGGSDLDPIMGGDGTGQW